LELKEYEEYVELIRAKEAKYQPDLFYFEHQLDINSNMKRILVDWMLDVRREMDFSPQTLFVAVNILDRYLSSRRRKVLRTKLQLVGATALWIAAKCQEQRDDRFLADFVEVCDNTFSKEEFLVRFSISVVVCS